jgi:hypothetical protein
MDCRLEDGHEEENRAGPINAAADVDETQYGDQRIHEISFGVGKR